MTDEPAFLWREFARHLREQEVEANATERAIRGETKPQKTDGIYRAARRHASTVGTRIRLQARLDNVRQTVQIDFGVGDAVHPQPQIIDYPVLLTSPPVRLNAYPVEAAIAEKFQAMVHLDLQNSRMKDFYDDI